MRKDSGWWNNFYRDFRPLFAMVDRKTTNADIRYLTRKLGLRKGMTFLDCPCGIGRIALPLAKLGIRVTGVDITEAYLDELGRKAAARGLEIGLLQADMRRIPFESEFDVAANLWTSFGYFEKESDNLLVLKRAYRALKPGGRGVLHVINRDWIVANFQSNGWLEFDGVHSLESRTFDYATSTNICEWNFIKDGEMTTHSVSLRMYAYHELIAMLEKAGFVDIEGYGSTDDTSISRDERMMWIFACKPEL